MDFNRQSWTQSDCKELVGVLKTEADLKYRDFHTSIVPCNDKNTFIGIRTPRLREISQEISKGDSRGFVEAASDEYYELRMLKAYVIGRIKPVDFEDFTSLCNDFVGSINNWAVCDGFCASLKQVNKYKPEFFEYINKFLKSNNEWELRFALVIMLDYYLDDVYIDAVLKRCDEVKSKAYYVSVARAWLLATAVAKCRDKTLDYLKSNSLDDITFNRTVQKCVESRRVDDKTKAYLRTLKRH